MRLLTLELECFRSHDALMLDLDALDQAVVLGSNGAGKSSLLAAIEFAWFGGRADDLLTFDSERGGVTLTFARGRFVYRVSRGRARGRKSWLVVEREVGEDWENLTRGSINETQAWLESDVLGLDRESFRASVYVPQGEAGAFAALNPGGRKELLAKLLGLDRYEEWRVTAATEARAREVQRNLAAGRVVELDERARDIGQRAQSIVALDLQCADAHREMARIDHEMDAALEREKALRARQLRSQIEVRMADLRDRAQRAHGAVAERTALAAVAATLPELEQALTEHDEAAQRHQEAQLAQSEVQGLQRQHAAAMRDLDALTKRLGTVEHTSHCPTCGQPTHGDARALALARLGAEREQGQAACAALAAQLEERLANAPTLNDYDAEEHRRLRMLVRAAENARARHSALANTEDVEQLRAEYANLRAQRDALPDGDVDGLLPEDVRQRQTQARDEMLRAERALDAARHAHAELERVNEEAARAREQHRVLGEEIETLRLLSQAFGRSGIPAMMLDNAVSVVEDAANDLLTELGAPYRIRLATQRTKKTGGVADTLEIVVDAGGRERVLESFSGGEKYRLHLALRVGLGAMVAGRSGNQIDFLLVDEPTDLDGDGMKTLAGVLTSLRRQVLLISHVQDLADEFPQRIFVSRDSDVSPSRVEVQ